MDSEELVKWDELKRKVEFLKKPEAYPDNPLHVEWIETHMSWVFLTDTYVYKLKKPVSFDYLNLTQLSDRKLNAQREVSLNQDLAPDYYLGIIPLVQTKSREFILSTKEEEGEIVDWIVLMKRFPRNLALDQLMTSLDPTDPRLIEASEILSSFYLNAPSLNFSCSHYRLYLENQLRKSEQTLSKKKYNLDSDLVHHIYGALEKFLSSHAQLFDDRVNQGKIIEAHGDLRPEHICLTSPPVVIDRLEFSLELRSLDPVDEICFLIMETNFLGCEDIGEVFLKMYENTTEDYTSIKLQNFYKSYRAFIRATISAWHLDDEKVVDQQKYFLRAQRYLNLAGKYLELIEDSVEGDRPVNHPPGYASSPWQTEEHNQ